MKKLLSSRGTAFVLLAVTLLTLAFYACMLLRPVSYGMEYTNRTEYEGGVFEGTMTFRSDMTVLNGNTNLQKPMESRYYYKNGYVFFLVGESDEDCAAEIARIDANFETAIAVPFSSARANAFEVVLAEADGYSTAYTCASAKLFAAIGGGVELVLLALTATAFILRHRARG